MRISDWSSDVCSSDLGAIRRHLSRRRSRARSGGAGLAARTVQVRALQEGAVEERAARPPHRRTRADRRDGEIGRASCRERVGPYVSISVGAVSLKKKKENETTYANDDKTKRRI